MPLTLPGVKNVLFLHAQSAGEGFSYQPVTEMSGAYTLVASSGITIETDEDVKTATIGLKSKTSYWSCPGVAFTAADHDPTPDFYSYSQEVAYANDDHITFVAPVTLPHGAVVTAVLVFGNVTDETYLLRRVPIVGGSSDTLADANINTEDTNISNATIDNLNYVYFFSTSTLDNSDTISGARITYTTNYD